MTKYEFINKLKAALENELDNTAVLGHINYYTDYINSEIQNGRSESDVISELGDPWAIAKNIISIEATDSDSYNEYSDISSNQDAHHKQGTGPNVHIFGIDSWWKKLLLFLGIIGVVMIIFTIISGLISFIAPFILPVIIISFVMKLFKKR